MNLMRFLIRSSRSIVMLSVIAGAASGIASIALIVCIQSELGREPSSSSAAVRLRMLCIVSAAARIIGQVGMVKLGQGAVAKLSLHIGSTYSWIYPCGNSRRLNTSSLLAALTEDIVLIANAMVGIPQLCINIPILIACLAYIGWLSPVIFVCGFSFAALAIAVYLSLSARAINEIREARSRQDVLVGHYPALFDGFRELKLHRGRRDAYLAESLEPTMVSARGQMVRGLSSFAVAEGWSQLAFFGFIGVLLFAMPHLEPISQADTGRGCPRRPLSNGSAGCDPRPGCPSWVVRVCRSARSRR